MSTDEHQEVVIYASKVKILVHTVVYLGLLIMSVGLLCGWLDETVTEMGGLSGTYFVKFWAILGIPAAIFPLVTASPKLLSRKPALTVSSQGILDRMYWGAGMLNWEQSEAVLVYNYFASNPKKNHTTYWPWL